MNLPDGHGAKTCRCRDTSNGQIRKALQSHFFRMAGTRQYSIFSVRTPYSLVKYSETIKLSSGSIPFNGSDDEFILNLSLQFLQVNPSDKGKV